jgi:hypothetical protein
MSFDNASFHKKKKFLFLFFILLIFQFSLSKAYEIQITVSKTAKFSQDLKEDFFALSYDHNLSKHFSAYIKTFSYQGESTAKEVWNRDDEKWTDIEESFETDGIFLGAGFKIHKNINKLLSTSAYLGYGYLNKPDNIFNSGHGQFNLGIDFNIKISSKSDLFLSWNHMSNGRQALILGNEKSKFYPNNGRDFLGIGIRYDI